MQNLNFGINNTSSYTQCENCGIYDPEGGDPLPGNPPGPNVCEGRYAMIGAFGTFNAGGNAVDFGPFGGQANSANRKVDILSGGSDFAPVIPRTIRTSYSYILANVRQAKVTEQSLSPYCGGQALPNCDLSGSIPEGVYVVNGNLNITGSGRFNFPAGTASNNNNYIILVDGSITIGKEIGLNANSSVIFSAKDDITVLGNVGTLTFTDSTSYHLQGVYSAGRNFIVAGNNNCGVGDDRRLNIEGNVIANSRLTGGGIQLNRLLCSINNQCPAFYVKHSPRLLLITPSVLRVPSFVWKEVAP